MHDLCKNIRRVSRRDGSGLTPGCCSAAAISRRSRSRSDMPSSPLDVLFFCFSYFAVTTSSWTALQVLLAQADPAQSYLFFQFNRQTGWLTGRDGHFLFDGSSEGLDRHQVVIAWRHVGDRE